jgi:anthranilate synthase component 1
MRRSERPDISLHIHTRDRVYDPASLYFSIRRSERPSFLLQSAAGPGENARYSVIGYRPLLYVRIEENRIHLDGDPAFVEYANRRAGSGDSISRLKQAMGFGDLNAPPADPRYALSCVGYISYDFVRELVPLGGTPQDDTSHPVLEFMLPSRVIVIDHLFHKTHFVCASFRGSEIDVRQEMEKMMSVRSRKPSAGGGTKTELKENMNSSDFASAVRKAKNYIRRGDAIQIVLSRRIELSPVPDLERFYMNLISINPSPYMFFLDYLGAKVVGSSPEILVRVQGRNVITRPIAGTRRRGHTPADEHAMERDLLSDEKERAEHVMLVDLGRNDLGRVSEFGSVRVTEFMRVEKYSHVQHLVSHVVGRLRPECDAFDAFRVTFPAGTVTGAPKVRAMEIIDELEPTRRGIYAGAVGSFSFTGDADLAITIRTLIANDRRALIQVGAGVVADSVPWKEYYETQNKARALLVAAGVEK